MFNPLSRWRSQSNVLMGAHWKRKYEEPKPAASVSMKDRWANKIAVPWANWADEQMKWDFLLTPPSLHQVPGPDTTQLTRHCRFSFSSKINSDMAPAYRTLTRGNVGLQIIMHWSQVQKHKVFLAAVWQRNYKCLHNRNKLVLARQFGDSTWHLWAVFRNRASPFIATLYDTVSVCIAITLTTALRILAGISYLKVPLRSLLFFIFFLNQGKQQFQK